MSKLNDKAQAGFDKYGRKITKWDSLGKVGRRWLTFAAGVVVGLAIGILF